MRTKSALSGLAPVLAAVIFLAGPALAAKPDRDGDDAPRKIRLPTSQSITVPSPGFIGRTNSYPAAVALSPDHRFAVLLNEGYATPQSRFVTVARGLDLA